MKTERFSAKRIGNFLINNAILIIMICVALGVWIARPNFMSWANIRNLISNTSVRFIVALGVSGCLITKGTDLSAGRAVGLAACLATTFMQNADYSAKVYPGIGDIPIFVVFIAVIVIMALIGTTNGLIISKLNVPPFIATLGMQTIVYGACQIFTGSQPIGGLRDDYSKLSNGGIGIGQYTFPYLGLYAIALGIIFWFVYNKTPHGKHIYAIGGNESAAEVSGINTTRTKILIYATAGLMYGIAGFLVGAKSGGASVNIGVGYELEAIAGCTIGGVSTNGGVGRVSGILVGVLVFELLKIAMQFMGVSPSYTYIVQGLVIVTAVALDIRKYIAKK